MTTRQRSPARADVLLRVCRDNLDDAITVGEAIIELLHAGETAQSVASLDADNDREP